MEALWGDVNIHHVCQYGSAFCSGLGYSHMDFYHFLLCLFCGYLMQLLALNSEFALYTGSPTTTTSLEPSVIFLLPQRQGLAFDQAGPELLGASDPSVLAS